MASSKLSLSALRHYSRTAPILPKFRKQLPRHTAGAVTSKRESHGIYSESHSGIHRPRVLITGALGQLGISFASILR